MSALLADALARIDELEHENADLRKVRDEVAKLWTPVKWLLRRYTRRDLEVGVGEGRRALQDEFDQRVESHG